MIEMTVGLGVLFGLMFLGQEIFLSMVAATIAGILVQQADFSSFMIIPQSMLFGLEGMDLAAISLFILAGELMNVGGMTLQLVNFSRTLIGHIRGGLSLVAVLVNMLMAGVSGSAVADASATGTVLIPAMKEEGYDSDYAAALLASAATIGPIIPPSIPMVIFGIMTNVSIGRLFLSGAVPGILMGLALFAICYVIARRRNYPKLPRSSVTEILRSFREALFALVMPVIIVGGVIFGLTTITETAGIAAAYSAFVGGIVFRKIKLSHLPRILIDSAVMSAVILVTLSTANSFAWLMSILQIGAKLSALIGSVSSNPLIILLIINFLLLVIGTVFEPLPAMIIFVPMMIPLVNSLGIDLVHFGLIVVFNLMLALLSPPVGLNFFITSTIAKTPVDAVMRELWPFFLVLVFVLILCTCIPELVLWLPRTLMP